MSRFCLPPEFKGAGRTNHRQDEERGGATFEVEKTVRVGNVRNVGNVGKAAAGFHCCRDEGKTSKTVDAVCQFISPCSPQQVEVEEVEEEEEEEEVASQRPDL